MTFHEFVQQCINGLSLGSEAVKDVSGYDLRRLLFGNVPVDWAVFRLAPLPERRGVRGIRTPRRCSGKRSRKRGARMTG